jgi:hypothetical protein
MKCVYESNRVRVTHNPATGSYYCDYRVKLFGIFPKWEMVLAKFSTREDAVIEGGRHWFMYNVMKKPCSTTVFNSSTIRVLRQGATYRVQRKCLGFIWLNISNKLYDNENDAVNESYHYAGINPSRTQKYIQDARKTLSEEFEKTKIKILHEASTGIGGAYEVGVNKLAE